MGPCKVIYLNESLYIVTAITPRIGQQYQENLRKEPSTSSFLSLNKPATQSEIPGLDINGTDFEEEAQVRHASSITLVNAGNLGHLGDK